MPSGMSLGRGAWRRKVDRTSSMLERLRTSGTLCRWQTRLLGVSNRLTFMGIRMGPSLDPISLVVSRLILHTWVDG